MLTLNYQVEELISKKNNKVIYENTYDQNVNCILKNERTNLKSEHWTPDQKLSVKMWINHQSVNSKINANLVIFKSK